MPITAPAGPIRHDRRVWHDTYRPTFTELCCIGYLEGGDTYNWGADVLAVASGISQLTFDESAGLGNTLALKELDDAGEVTYIWSSSASDDGSVCQVEGVAPDNSAIVETVVLDNAAPVAVSTSVNINQIQMLTGGSNVGTVYCSTKATVGAPTSADNVQCLMRPTHNQAHNAMFMCPTNYAYIWEQSFLSCDKGDSLAIDVWSRSADTGLWYHAVKLIAYEKTFALNLQPQIGFTEGAKLCVTLSNIGGSPIAATIYSGLIQLNGTLSPAVSNAQTLFT